MKYRPEIDGLRALAVVPVILFHAGFELFSGGFVGIDVFFVISGYLITTILIEDIENKRFNIVNFYERRARRILPALLFVMLICIPFSVQLLPPDELKDFFQSLMAAAVFASNILFWRESGYFDSEAADKPLLHTWSLAIEEQYYVLFPIFLILAWRFGKNRVFWMIVVMAAISFLLSEWGWRNKPRANFYLAPTRAWELFAGSIAAFVVQKKGVQRNNTLAFLGLTAIISPIFAYNKLTPTPSVYTLLPVFGVVSLILFADKVTFVARLLSIKPLVGIGLISYSAYLWHQPMLTFAKIYFFDGLSSSTTILIVIMFAVSYLSWRYIETPFRGPEITRRQVYSSVFSILFGFIALGLSYQFSLIQNKEVKLELEWGNVVHELPKKFGGIELDDKNCSGRVPAETCVLGGGEKQIVIIGDSHARVLTEAAYELSREGKFKLVDMSSGGCPFFYGLNVFTYGKLFETCTEKYQADRLSYIKSLKPSIILLHSRFPLYIHGNGFNNTVGGKEPERSFYVGITGKENHSERFEVIRGSFLTTVRELLSANHDVIIVSPVPTNGWSTAKRLMRVVNHYKDLDTFTLRSLMSIPRLAVEERQAQVNVIFNDVKQQFPSVKFFNSLDVLCDSERCHAISDSGEILYADRDHLSPAGSRLLLSESLKLIFKSSNN